MLHAEVCFVRLGSFWSLIIRFPSIISLSTIGEYPPLVITSFASQHRHVASRVGNLGIPSTRS